MGIAARLAAVVSILVVGVSADASAQTRPNFIVILADDLGWGDLSVYGHLELVTPELDELAGQGTLFTQAYVAAAVCSPTRASILTGRFPAHLRIHDVLTNDPERHLAKAMDDYLDPAVTTLSGLLQADGYVTGQLGKWHLGSVEGSPEPGAYGFDEHVTLSSTGPQLVDPLDDLLTFRARSSELLVDEAIAFIDAHQDQPFFLNLWTMLPHSVLNPTAEQVEFYDHFAVSGAVDRGAKQIYYASVTDLDTQIGRLVDHIDTIGLGGQTVVVFMSDNGPAKAHVHAAAAHSGIGSAGPFRGYKSGLYEGGVRVPFLVRWRNRVPAGRVEDDSVIASVDLLPTIASIAGVELPVGETFDGEDVSDIWLGASRGRTKPLMWEYRFEFNADVTNKAPVLAIRNGDWKLLMNPDSSRVELFNMVTDRRERTNLAEQRPAIVADLSQQVLAWQATLPEGPYHERAGDDSYPWPVEPESRAPVSPPER
jgi:N-acetylgalactosamine-6-sulfatase